MRLCQTSVCGNRVLTNLSIACSFQVVRNVVGYVTQHDFLLPLLSVEETLTYSARLRMPETMADADKLRRVAIVIRDLGLKARARKMHTAQGCRVHAVCVRRQKRSSTQGPSDG